MTAAGTTPAVEVGIRTPAGAPDGLGQAVAEALARVAAQLGLPADPRVVDGPAASRWEPAADGPPQVVVEVGGRPLTCPADHRLLSRPDAAAALVAVDAREALLTAGVCRALWEAWELGPPEPARIETFGRLLRTAVAAATPVEAIRPGARELGTGAGSPARSGALLERHLDVAIEEALAAPARASVAVSMASTDLATHRELDAGDARDARAVMALVAEGMFHEAGLVVDLQVTEETDREPGTVGLQVGAVTYPDVPGLPDGSTMVNAAPAWLAGRGIRAEPTRNPANGDLVALVKGDASVRRCDELGLVSWGWLGEMALVCSQRIRANAPTFVSLPVYRGAVAQIRPWWPDLVAAADELYGPARMSAVLRRLAGGGAPIRNLPRILDRLLHLEATVPVADTDTIVVTPGTGDRLPVADGRSVAELTAGELAAVARRAAGPLTAARHARDGVLAVLTLAPDAEALVGSLAPISPAQDPAPARPLLDGLAAARAEASACRVLLVSASLRDAVEDLVRVTHPDLAVVSYAELPADTQLAPAGRVHLP